MYLSTLTTSVAVLAGLANVAQSHPGHDLTQEIAERDAYIRSVRSTSVRHCAEKLRLRGIEARNVARRAAIVSDARAARGLGRRDVSDDLAKSHNETDTGYTENTSISKLFSSNSSCLLTPEVTQGPYCKFLFSELY